MASSVLCPRFQVELSLSLPPAPSLPPVMRSPTLAFHRFPRSFLQSTAFLGSSPIFLNSLRVCLANALRQADGERQAWGGAGPVGARFRSSYILHM